MRALDPCLSCFTDAFGPPAFRPRLPGASGAVLDQRGTSGGYFFLPITACTRAARIPLCVTVPLTSTIIPA